MGKASRLIQQKTLQNMMYNVWQHALTEKNWYLLIDVYKSVLVVEHKISGSKTISETLIALTLIMYYTKNYKHTQKKHKKEEPSQNKQTKQTPKQNKTMNQNKTKEHIRNKPQKKSE